MLFSVKNSTKFIIHSRMSKARVSQNASISESKATVFSGFAMKSDQGALVEFYLNVTSKSFKTRIEILMKDLYKLFVAIFCIFCFISVSYNKL